MRAMQLTTELGRYLGNAIATMVVGSADEDPDWWALVLYILDRGLDNLTPEATESIVLRTMESVSVDGSTEHLGTRDAFNAHFEGPGLLTAMEVWRWALKVNFRDSFVELRSRRLSTQGGAAETPTSDSRPVA